MFERQGGGVIRGRKGSKARQQEMTKRIPLNWGTAG